MEFDDLSSKSHEAEKEVNLLQMKIQEVNYNLSKHRKDVDCKYPLISWMKLFNIVAFLTFEAFFMRALLLMHINYIAGVLGTIQQAALHPCFK